MIFDTLTANPGCGL